ncbi:MAG: response regulator [Oligoflexus sp.]
MGSVLIVDDQSEFLEFLKHSMESSGFQVETASDAFEALAKVRSADHIDCILTDYHMPGMNGHELASRIKHSSNIPVILMTGDPDFSFEECYKSGISGIMVKPVNAKLFIEFLKNNDLHLENKLLNQRKFLRRNPQSEKMQIEISNGETTSVGQLLNMSAGGLGINLNTKDMRLSTVQFKLTYEGENLEGYMHCRWKGVIDDKLKAGFEFDSITKRNLIQSAAFKKILML